MENCARSDTCRSISFVQAHFDLLHLQGMERRADKHLARQDDVLIRAVTRVWKARERGKLLERVRALRLVKGAWSIWRERMRQHRRLEGDGKYIVMIYMVLIVSRLCVCIQHAIQFIRIVVHFGNLASSLYRLSEPSGLRDPTTPCSDTV